MTALKFTNVIVALALVLAAIAWLIKGGVSLGGLTALALPIVAFGSAIAALQAGSKKITAAAIWLNIVLLVVYLIADLLVLFVFRSRIGNALAIIIFQTVFISLPAFANIAMLIAKKRASK